MKKPEQGVFDSMTDYLDTDSRREDDVTLTLTGYEAATILGLCSHCLTYAKAAGSRETSTAVLEIVRDRLRQAILA